MTQMLTPVSRKVTFDLIVAYGKATLDENPIHTDRAFAEATEMNGIIAHGTIALNLLWSSIEATVGRPIAAGTTLDVRFVAPVREDEVLTAQGTQSGDSGDGYDVEVITGDGTVVVRGTALLPKECTG